MNDIMGEVEKQLHERGAEIFSTSGAAITFGISGQVYLLELKWLGGQTIKTNPGYPMLP